MASFLHEWTAHLAKGRLETEGIQAAVWDGYTISTCWIYSVAIGGVRIAVAPADLERAKEVLATPYAGVLGEIEESGLPAPPEEVCPVCGLDGVGPRRYSAWGLFPSLLLGVPLFWRPPGWRCRMCDAEGEWEWVLDDSSS